MSAKFIYLDHAAATPVDKRVKEAMAPYWSQKFYNPSATYGPARQSREALEAARSKVGYWLGAKPSEVIFTAGGTEANNLAVHGVMRKYPEANIVVAAIEHESVLAPARQYDYRKVAVHPDGRIDLDDLRTKIDSKTVLISVGYANNEIGTVQPIREIAKIVAEQRANRSKLPIYLHTDACQAGNYLDLHAARLNIDLMSLNGGKIYGPKQSGALYIKSGIQLEPLIYGGGQERRLRSGTENVAGSVGMAVALDLAQQDRRNETVRLQKLQKQFVELLQTQLPIAKINGSLKYRLPNNVHIAIPGQDNERLLIQLEEAGILGAAGSACSASDEEPSHVLAAIGLGDAEARTALRFSLGRTTTSSDVIHAVKELVRLASP